MKDIIEIFDRMTVEQSFLAMKRGKIPLTPVNKLICLGIYTDILAKSLENGAFSSFIAIVEGYKMDTEKNMHEALHSFKRIGNATVHRFNKEVC